MDSAVFTSSTFLPFQKPKPFSLNPKTLTSVKTHKPSPKISVVANSSCNHNIVPSNGCSKENPFAQTLKKAAGTLVLTLAASLMAAKFSALPVRAEPVVETAELEEEKLGESAIGSEEKSSVSSLSDELVDELKEIMQKRLELGEDEEALKILTKIVEAQPSQIEWKFLNARLLTELGKPTEAREVFEEILALNPLSFEALFENALLMDRCGEKEAVIPRLEKALRIAEDEEKAKEARDVKMIMAQFQFLQKNVEEALQSYEELTREDPKDFRPYFCRGMIYSLLDRNTEAREEFAKYKELSPNKFEAEGFLRTSLSRMKLFGTGSEN